MNECNINMLSTFQNEAYRGYMQLSKQEVADNLKLIADVFKSNIEKLREKFTLQLKPRTISRATSSASENLDDLKNQVELMIAAVCKCRAVLSYLNMKVPAEFEESEREVLAMKTFMHQNHSVKQLTLKFLEDDALDIPVLWDILCDRCQYFENIALNRADWDVSGIELECPISKDHFQLLLCHLTHPDCFFLLVEDQQGNLKELSNLHSLMSSLEYLGFKWGNIHPNNDKRLAKHFSLLGNQSRDMIQQLSQREIWDRFYAIISPSLGELPESRKALENLILLTLERHQHLPSYSLDFLSRADLVDPNAKKLTLTFNDDDKFELPVFFWDFLSIKFEYLEQITLDSNVSELELPISKSHFQVLLPHLAISDFCFSLIENLEGNLKDASTLDALIKSLQLLGFRWGNIHPDNDERLAGHLHQLIHRFKQQACKNVIAFFYSIVGRNLNELPKSRKAFERMALNELMFDAPSSLYGRELLPGITDLNERPALRKLDQLQRVCEWCPNVERLVIESYQESYENELRKLKKLKGLRIVKKENFELKLVFPGVDIIFNSDLLSGVAKA